jgi:hypothetical protein
MVLKPFTATAGDTNHSRLRDAQAHGHDKKDMRSCGRQHLDSELWRTPGLTGLNAGRSLGPYSGMGMEGTNELDGLRQFLQSIDRKSTMRVRVQ